MEEKILFSDSQDTIQLLVNPETLTLTWKKILNRVRTKTRLVTLFWGEEPVKFAYRGQTGFAYPTLSERDEKATNYIKSSKMQIAALQNEVSKYTEELRKGGPYTLGTIDATRVVLDGLNETIGSYSAALVPRTTLSQNLNAIYTNTQILYLSEKFRILKKLESMYRRHTKPDSVLAQIGYREYIFSGYFESFSYIDDARSPWNWVYNIDFTILDWKENPESKLTSDGEIGFVSDSTISSVVDTAVDQGILDETEVKTTTT